MNIQTVDGNERGARWSELRGAAPRVLVVEDDPVQAMILMLFLEGLGFTAKHVSDGAQGVEEVRQGDYAVVLMDQWMPGTCGMDAARAIRRWEKPLGRHVPIIAVSASVMPDECCAYLDSGMDTVLSKPFTESDLRWALQSCADVSAHRAPAFA